MGSRGISVESCICQKQEMGAVDRGYNVGVEKRIRVYSSHQEADEADVARDKALTPQERLNITIELRNQRHPDAAQQRLARVHRVTKLERS